MASPEWYYAQDDTQFGPVSAAELKRLADRGQLKPGDLIWREGMEEWVEAKKFKKLFDDPPGSTPGEAGVLPDAPPPPQGAPDLESAPASKPSARGPVRHVFDLVLDFARSQFTTQSIDLTSTIFCRGGHYGLYLAIGLLLVFSILLGVKTNDVNVVLLGMAGVVMLVVLQYAAGRFFGALERLNRSTPARMSSRAFLDCCALLNMFGGLVALLALTVVAVQTGTTSDALSLILPAIAAFILCQYVGILALNPESLNVVIESQATAGEEAIGVLSFLVKVTLKIVPVAFGVGVVWGAILLFYAGFLVLVPLQDIRGIEKPAGLKTAEQGQASSPPTEHVPDSDSKESEESELRRLRLQAAPARMTALNATSILMVSAALPLLAYVLFLVFYLTVDVLRAILLIPGKLDDLAEEPEKTD